MPYADRNKQIEYKRNWNKQFYASNKLREKERIAKRKKSIAQWIIEYKAVLTCEQCGENTPICLDFHHVDQTQKELSISNVKTWGWSIKRLELEIAKCVVLCSNCHRKIHAGLI